MNKKGLENFWYYNKYKVIAVVLVAAGFILFINFHSRDIPHDVEIAYVTDGRLLSQEAQDYLNGLFAPIIMDVTGDKKRETGLKPLQGLQTDLEFVSDGSQIVLMDGNTLGKMIHTGALEPLDAYKDKYKLDLSGNPEVSAEIDGAKGSHIYAIPVKFLSLLLEAGFPADDYYLTVRTVYAGNKTERDKNRNAYAIVRTLLDQNANYIICD